jgi:hypothetical protein
MSLATSALVSSVGTILVGAVAAWYWRRVSGVPARWFWLGAGLWAVAIAVKVAIALVTNAVVLNAFRERFPYWLFVLAGGAYVGLESSACEIGLTLLVGLRWKGLGRDAGRAIAVGVGAGAFEAMILGVAGLAGVLAWRAGLPGTEPVGEAFRKAAALTPLFWLVSPVERVTAILCHAASRGLVLVGARQGKLGLIAAGFLLFTAVDGLAGAGHLSGTIGSVSMWWVELVLSVFGLVSLPLLVMLMRRYGEAGEVEGSQTPNPPATTEAG